MSGEKEPTELELRVMMFRALEQMFLHSEASTKYIIEVSSRLAGVAAHSQATVEAVDENEARAQLEREIEARKQIISHLLEKSHQYVTVIVAGAYAAYFATLSLVVARFSDVQLRWSALLMTISLTVFVLWEVAQVTFIGWHTMKGDLGILGEHPKWYKIGWPIALFASVATALPAIGLSLYVYVSGLGVFNLFGCN